MAGAIKRFFGIFKPATCAIGIVDTTPKRLFCTSIGISSAIATGVAAYYSLSYIHNTMIESSLLNSESPNKSIKWINDSTQFTMWSYFFTAGSIFSFSVSCINCHSTFLQIRNNMNCCGIVRSSLSGSLIASSLALMTYICYHFACHARSNANICLEMEEAEPK